MTAETAKRFPGKILRTRKFPSLKRRGGCAEGADGVVISAKCFGRADHPGAQPFLKLRPNGLALRAAVAPLLLFKGSNILDSANVLGIDLEIGRILHLKSEIRDLRLDCAVQFGISDFGFEVQDSSNFEMFSPNCCVKKSQRHKVYVVSRSCCACSSPPRSSFNSSSGGASSPRPGSGSSGISSTFR